MIAPDIASIFMAIARIRLEPYVWFLFKKRWNRCRREKHRVEKLAESEESLCSLTNSALNVELVYAIIVGINSLIDQNLVVMSDDSIESDF